MLRIEVKGNVAHITKVSSYTEGVTKHWYLVVEMNQVRQAQKVADKLARKYLHTLMPTANYCHFENEKIRNAKPSTKADKKALKKSNKTYRKQNELVYDKRRKVTKYKRNAMYWYLPSKGDYGWVHGTYVATISKNEVRDPMGNVYKNVEVVKPLKSKS